MTRGKRPRRHDGDEDQRLWSMVTRQVAPLKKAKRRVGTPGAMAEADLAAKPLQGRPADVDEKYRGVDAAGTEPFQPPTRPSRKSDAAPPLTDIDRRRARKLGSGHTEIDARIDLHGMRQAPAHAALRAFLVSAQARGLRNVLVITGKGGARRQAEGSDDDGYERGVLNRVVPQWLAQPDLRAVVVGFGAAGRRHGGAGAYYVQLRRGGR